MNRIAIVSTNAFVPWAGSEELWSQCAIRLAAQGYTIGVNVAGFDQKTPQTAHLEEKSRISVHRRARRWRPWQRVARGFASWYNPDVDSWLRNFRPDLVVISQGGTTDGLEWMRACRNQQVPYAVIVHLATDAFWPEPAIVASIREHFGVAAALCFVSEDNRQVTAKHFGLPLANAIIVRNPFLVAYDNQIPWPKINDGYLRLACVGRLGAEHKGQDLLFSVLRKAKWKERMLTVTLVGSGHHREMLERLHLLWNVPNIRFGGQTNNVEEVWATHHALIMPSRYEGLPLALVEAMLCRRPAIVTDVGGNRELVEDGVNGFVAAAATETSLDEALERAWQKRDHWEAMGKQGGDFVRSRIPSDPVGTFTDKITALLQEIRSE